MYRVRLAALLAGLVLCHGGNALAQHHGHRGGVPGAMGSDHMRQGGQGRVPGMDQGRNPGNRGLDRADEAAGEHGAAGRTRARQGGLGSYSENKGPGRDGDDRGLSTGQDGQGRSFGDRGMDRDDGGRSPGMGGQGGHGHD